MLQQIIILLQRLGKAEPGIENHVAHAQVVQMAHTLRKIEHHLTLQVFISRKLLHVGRRTAHVHQDIRHLQVGNGTKHIPVKLTARNVVNDVGTTFFHTHPGHIGTKRIDG